MARMARLVVPNVAHHVLHRAIDREPIFISDDDYVYYLHNLEESRASLGCRIYAFCIMLNHVHLLVDPGSDRANLGRLMKRLAGRQAGYIRKSHRSAGPKWEGRFRSSPVANDFLLPCARYIELNPVRIRLVRRPQGYLWSSAKSKLGLAPPLVDLDDRYVALGSTPEERRMRYHDYLHAPIPFEEWAAIRAAIQGFGVTGDDGFRVSVEMRAGRQSLRRRPGRPRKREPTNTVRAEH